MVFDSDCGHVQLRCGGSTSTKGHAPKAPSHFRAEPKPLLLPWSCKVFQCNFPRSKTEFQSKFERTGKINQHDCSFILWRSVEYAIVCNSTLGSWMHLVFRMFCISKFYIFDRKSSNPARSRPPATSSPPHNSARQAMPFEANG